MATSAQIWARKRNFTKSRLKGVRPLLFAGDNLPQIYTENEQELLYRALRLIDEVLGKWGERNEVSKNRYLNFKGGNDGK